MVLCYARAADRLAALLARFEAEQTLAEARATLDAHLAAQAGLYQFLNKSHLVSIPVSVLTKSIPYSCWACRSSVILKILCIVCGASIFLFK